MNSEALWALGRGTGITALAFLTVSLALGIATRSGRPLIVLPRFAVADVHRFAALVLLIDLAFGFQLQRPMTVGKHRRLGMVVVELLQRVADGLHAAIHVLRDPPVRPEPAHYEYAIECDQLVKLAHPRALLSRGRVRQPRAQSVRRGRRESRRFPMTILPIRLPSVRQKPRMGSGFCRKGVAIDSSDRHVCRLFRWSIEDPTLPDLA